jgi:O-antigen ligase
MRFEDALVRGDLAKREDLYPTAWKMFLERPLLGWGPVNHNYELEWRLRDPRYIEQDTHNLLLELLTATGLLGAIPFLAGTWLCMRAAWRARAGPRGVLPVAMGITVLMINMSVDWIFTKTFWLVLAYALASGSPLVKRGSNRRVPALDR